MSLRKFFLSQLLLFSVAASSCAISVDDRQGMDDVSFGKLDDPACVQELKAFFESHASVSDDFLRYWQSEHRAFGSADNMIQFSWEMEGTNNSIMRYYHPNAVPQSEWSAMSLAERQEWMRSSGVSWKQPWWRMDGAPEYLRKTLNAEAGGRVWETTSATFARTADELFDQAMFAQKSLDASGGFHWHVTFKPDPRYADEITDFLAQGNEFTTLKMYASSPRNIHHPFLEPYSFERLERIRQALRSGLPKSDKFATFSLRSGIYDDAARVGFEIRAVNYDLDTARAAVGNSIRFLDDPKNATIGFGARTSGYRMADVAEVRRLDSVAEGWLLELNQGFLRELEEAAIQHAGYRAADATTTGPLRRWAIPMLRWENRQYIPNEARIAVESSRAEFVSKVQTLAEQYASAGKAADAQAVTVMENLVYTWARQTRLWDYF